MADLPKFNLRFDDIVKSEIDGVLAEQKVRPGQTQRFEFEIQTLGTYKYRCALPGHEQAGMLGTLTMEP